MQGLRIGTAAVTTNTSLPSTNPIFDPSSLPGAHTWWDCDSLVTVDGSANVTSWTDKFFGMIAGVTYATGNPATKPTYNGTAVNGHHPIVCPAVSSAMNVSQSLYPAGDQLLFWVGQLPVLSTFQTLLPRLIVNGIIAWHPVAASSGGDTYIANANISQGNNLVVGYKDSTDGLWRLRVNGVSGDPVAINGTVAASDTGMFFPGVGGQGSGIAGGGCILSQGYALGAQTLLSVEKLEGYLAQRFFGTTFLPNGHPYQSVAPRLLS